MGAPGGDRPSAGDGAGRADPPVPDRPRRSGSGTGSWSGRAAGPEDGLGEAVQPVEVRPSRAAAGVVAVVAVASGVAAVAAVVAGEVVVGVIALVSAGWLGSLARTAWRASSVADRDGVEVVWLGTRRRVSWPEVDSVVIEGVMAGGVLGSTTLVVRSGAHLRWAPWYPFLWFTHLSVRRSVEQLSALALAQEIEVTDVAASRDRDRPA